MDVLDAFVAEAAAVEATIRSIPVEAWAAPGLGEWTVAELVAHLVRAADRVPAYLAEPEPAAADPILEPVAYFTWTAAERAELAVGVAQRSRDDAARIGVPGLPAAFAESWRETERLVRAAPGDRRVRTIRGAMHVRAFLATRVLELVVHHLDLRRALDLPAAPTAAGLALTAELLDGLLAGPRPAGLDDDVAFVLAATGREPSPDPRLPVLN